MCPVCIAAAAQIVVGTTSTAGFTAVVLNRLRKKLGSKKVRLQSNLRENSSWQTSR
jgi:hypothetical protein